VNAVQGGGGCAAGDLDQEVALAELLQVEQRKGVRKEIVPFFFFG
jgi:hypothetical protein